jgi:hypothetical protein
MLVYRSDNIVRKYIDCCREEVEETICSWGEKYDWKANEIQWVMKNFSIFLFFARLH